MGNWWINLFKNQKRTFPHIWLIVMGNWWITQTILLIVYTILNFPMKKRWSFNANCGMIPQGIPSGGHVIQSNQDVAMIIGLPSGKLTVCYLNLPIYRWFTVLKNGDVRGKLLNNQRVIAYYVFFSNKTIIVWCIYGFIGYSMLFLWLHDANLGSKNGFWITWLIHYWRLLLEGHK